MLLKSIDEIFNCLMPSLYCSMNTCIDIIIIKVLYTHKNILLTYKIYKTGKTLLMMKNAIIHFFLLQPTYTYTQNIKVYKLELYSILN